MIKRWLCFFYIFCTVSVAFCTDSDSLHKLIKSEKDELKQLKLLDKLFQNYLDVGEIDSAIIYGKIGFAAAEKKRESAWLDRFSRNLVEAYYIKADWGNMLKEALNGFKIQKYLGSNFGIANSYNNLGITYQYGLKNSKQALAYYLQALNKFKQLDSVKQVGDCYINIGTIYDDIGNYSLAFEYLEKGVKIKRKLQDRENLATALQSLGGINLNLNKVQEALHCYDEAEKVYIALGKDRDAATIFCNKGDAYLKLKDYNNALANFKSGFEIAEQIGDLDLKRNIYAGLSIVNAELRKFELAYYFHVKFKAANDSMFNESKNNLVAEITNSFENEKRKGQIDQIKIEKEQQAQLAEKEKRLRYIFVFAFFMMFALAFVLYRSFQQKKAANEILKNQKKEIEFKNHEIQQSIAYAERIQFSILPPASEIQNVFKNSFILFLPKDVVSGDFYWFYESSNYYFIAAADCTGHGVPGSLMSMLCSQLLSNAVQQNSNTNEILKFINKGIKKALRQNEYENSSRDGMDIALCCFNKNFTQLSYSGANRPLIHVRNSELVEYTATKRAIGGLTDNDQEFLQTTIELSSGDSIYIYTDGYSDQFGGVTNVLKAGGKKLKSKILKEKLLAYKNYNSEQQAILLKDYFNDWKGNLDQTDDVLIIGISI